MGILASWPRPSSATTSCVCIGAITQHRNKSFDQSPGKLTYTRSLVGKLVALHTLTAEGAWVVVTDGVAPTH